VRIAFPTDEHFPFQDEQARLVALQIVSDFNPDIRIAGSDGLDFYGLSRFDKNPRRVKVGLQMELDAWMAGQREWRSAAPNAEAFYLVGNHEDRLRRYLWNNPELHDLEVLRLPNILRMAELGITWEMEKGDRANRELVVNGQLVIKHGSVVRKHSAYSARGELENESGVISVMTGHTHRGGSTYLRTRKGIVQAHEGFCLCSLEPEYVEHPNWQQGILLATITEDGVSIEPVPFYRSYGRVKAVWRGREYID
jgi:hypothetical protein